MRGRRARAHEQRHGRNVDAIQSGAQVAEIDATVDIRRQPRIAVPEDALRDDERRAGAGEQSCRGRTQIVEADGPVNGLRPELHAANGAVPPGRIGVVFDVRGATALAAAAAVVIAIHQASAGQGGPQDALKRRVPRAAWSRPRSERRRRCATREALRAGMA